MHATNHRARGDRAKENSVSVPNCSNAWMTLVLRNKWIIFCLAFWPQKGSRQAIECAFVVRLSIPTIVFGLVLLRIHCNSSLNACKINLVIYHLSGEHSRREWRTERHVSLKSSVIFHFAQCAYDKLSCNNAFQRIHHRCTCGTIVCRYNINPIALCVIKLIDIFAGSHAHDARNLDKCQLTPTIRHRTRKNVVYPDKSICDPISICFCHRLWPGCTVSLLI